MLFSGSLDLVNGEPKGTPTAALFIFFSISSATLTPSSWGRGRVCVGLDQGARAGPSRVEGLERRRKGCPQAASPEQHPQLHKRIGDGPTLPLPETAAIALRARLCLDSDRVTLSTVREI